ncbi:MAG: hypothetical protein PHQ75_01055 [Thermoguttaceae bacterium]|nr:hypothetical protein [Thermoguttaceae bacterium]
MVPLPRRQFIPDYPNFHILTVNGYEKLRALKNQGVKEGERPTPNRERIPKKSGGILCEGVEVKYACIRENRDSWPVTMMCRLLRVSTSGYYASLTRQPNRAEVKRELVARVASEIYQEEHRIPGYRKIHRKVCIQGTKCGVETVRLACRRAGIVSCVVKRRYRPKTTDSKHRHRINKNVLARNFKA